MSKLSDYVFLMNRGRIWIKILLKFVSEPEYNSSKAQPEKHRQATLHDCLFRLLGEGD
jgi:hypothetical protein